MPQRKSDCLPPKFKQQVQLSQRGHTTFYRVGQKVIPLLIILGLHFTRGITFLAHRLKSCQPMHNFTTKNL